MRSLFILCAILCALATSAPAGIVFEFNGKKWSPKPTRKVLKQSNAESICLIADSGTPMGKFLPVLKLLRDKEPRSLKLQLRDQLHSVTLTHALAEKDSQEDYIAVLTGPGGTFLIPISPSVGNIEESSKLNLDLAGLQHFINHATTCYETETEQESPPITALMLRPDCTFGQLVTIAQILKQAGMGSVAIGINDEDPGPDADIEIVMDKSVKIPAAEPPNSGQKTKLGRITINIDAEGNVLLDDETTLNTDAEIATYIRDQKAKFDKEEIVPKIHLRSDRASLFTHARRIIKLAAQEGVNEVIFVSYNLEKLKKQIERTERDVDMALPSSIPLDPGAVQIPPLFIKVDTAGRIYLNPGPAQETLDIDPKDRDLPLLSKRLEALAADAKAAGQQPLVQLYVEKQAIQSRIIDVLNVLAKHKIDKVTFTDLLDDE